MRVLIDIYDPSRLSSPATESDILLATHTHPDHIHDLFLSKFKGKQLFETAGETKKKDLSIKGIPAAHNEGDFLLPQSSTNYIFIVDTDSPRRVH